MSLINKIFTYSTQEIRTIISPLNIIWFCGVDVAKILDYKNPNKAIYDHVDEFDKNSLEFLNAEKDKISTIEPNQNNVKITSTTFTEVRSIISEKDKIILIENSKIAEDNNQDRLKITSWDKKLNFINESGLYSLILSSKLPTAKIFRHWVTSEVLPSIIRTNNYTLTEEKEFLKDIKDFQDQIDKLEGENKSLIDENNKITQEFKKLHKTHMHLRVVRNRI